MIGHNYLSHLLAGFVVSLRIAGLSLALGLPVGIVLAALSDARSRALRIMAVTVVEIGRGMPTLVLLGLLYYGLPKNGILLSSSAAAVLGLGYGTAAYTAEIFRASFRAISNAQRDGAAGLGLGTLDSFRFVILPQGVRIALPQIVSFSILILQGTALCYSIALPELLTNAYQLGSADLNYLKYLLIASALYLAVAFPVSQFASFLERRASARLRGDFRSWRFPRACITVMVSL